MQPRWDQHLAWAARVIAQDLVDGGAYLREKIKAIRLSSYSAGSIPGVSRGVRRQGRSIVTLMSGSTA